MNLKSLLIFPPFGLHSRGIVYSINQNRNSVLIKKYAMQTPKKEKKMAFSF